MDKPLEITNYIDDIHLQRFRNYIDRNYKSFSKITNGLYIQKFGIDSWYEDSSVDISSLYDIRDLFFIYVKKLLKTYRETFSDDQIYLDNLWFVKRFKDVGQPVHNDTDGGRNPQLKYSGILYLNSIARGGEIKFPNIDYKYKPKAGSLILFPSRGSQWDHEVLPTFEQRYTIPIFFSDDKKFDLMEHIDE